jgi:hypothetical protein
MATRDYVIKLPRDTTIVAACEDVGCDQWRDGWETVCDEADDMGGKVAMLIRSGQTGRDYVEFPGTTVTVFRFAPHQRCFREHRTRPARFLVRPGGGALPVAHTRLADWGDDLMEHGGRLADGARKG